MNSKDFIWTREPEKYEISENRILITTAPHTDLWQRTYYHFRNDNAPVLQMETEERFFSFVVKTNFENSMGVVRTTYLIDENGVIVKAFGKVKAADNPLQMLGVLEGE